MTDTEEPAAIPAGEPSETPEATPEATPPQPERTYEDWYQELEGERETAMRMPSLKPREVVGALERAGFIVERQTGSHVILRHPERAHKVTVPWHNRDLKRDTLASILRQAGLTASHFRRLL